jgi:hypothetical protein
VAVYVCKYQRQRRPDSDHVELDLLVADCDRELSSRPAASLSPFHFPFPNAMNVG